MVLPLMAILAAGVGGGAVTGYAGEVQRKKIKAEEDDEFLRRLQLQTAESEKLAKIQSKLRVTEKEADLERQRRDRARAVNLDPETATLAEIVKAENLQKVTQSYSEKEAETKAGLGLSMLAAPGEIPKAKEEQFKKEQDYKAQKKREEIDYQSTVDKNLLLAERFSSSFEVPNTASFFDSNGVVIPSMNRVNKKIRLIDRNTAIREKDDPDALQLNNFTNNIGLFEQFMNSGSPAQKETVIREFQKSLYGYKKNNLMLQNVNKTDDGEVFNTIITTGTLVHSFPTLAKSEVFGPLLSLYDQGKDPVAIENYIQGQLGVNVIAKSKTKNQDSKGNVKVTGEYSYNEKLKQPTLEFDCAIGVSDDTKKSCNAVRNIILESKGETLLDSPNLEAMKINERRFNDRMNVALTVSKKNNTNFGVKGSYLQGNPKGDGMPVLDLVTQLRKDGVKTDFLYGQLQTLIPKVEKTKGQSMFGSVEQVSENQQQISVAPDGQVYQAILDSGTKAGIDDFSVFIKHISLYAPETFGTQVSFDKVYKKMGFVSEAKVASDKKSLLALRGLGITYVQTVPQESIEKTANKLPSFKTFAAKYDLQADPLATPLTGTFLGFYNTYFNVLPSQLQALVKAVIPRMGEADYGGLTREDEASYASVFAEFVTKNFSTDDKGKLIEGSRFLQLDVDSQEVTDARKERTLKIYDENGKYLRSRKFRDNQEFINYEREAYQRNQDKLAQIQEDLRSGNDIQGARRELLKFMMAYELASFMQGGTGGRTISDQDVENMLRAIGAKGWTTSEAIVGGTLQLLVNLQEQADLYEALNSKDPSRVIGAIYARNNYLRDFRPNFSNRSIYDNLNYNELDPTLESEKPPAINKYEFDSNNNPIINKQKKTDAIVGVS